MPPIRISEQEARERLIILIAEQMGLPSHEMADSTHLVNDLGADSLDTVEITMEVEEEFDIVIPDATAEALRTLGDFVTYVAAHAS